MMYITIFLFFLQEEGVILFATHQWSPVCLTFNFFSHLFLFRVFSLFCLKFLLQSGNSNNTPRVNKTVTSNTSSLICQQERKCALVFVSIIMNDAMACIAQTFLCSLQSTQPTACELGLYSLLNPSSSKYYYLNSPLPPPTTTTIYKKLC